MRARVRVRARAARAVARVRAGARAVKAVKAVMVARAVVARVMVMMASDKAAVGGGDEADGSYAKLELDSKRPLLSLQTPDAKAGKRRRAVPDASRSRRPVLESSPNSVAFHQRVKSHRKSTHEVDGTGPILLVRPKHADGHACASLRAGELGSKRERDVKGVTAQGAREEKGSPLEKREPPGMRRR